MPHPQDCCKEVVWGNKVRDQKGKEVGNWGLRLNRGKKGREDPLFKDFQRKGACLRGLGSWLKAQNYPH